MCTVTFIPTSNGYFLTSNRDEKSTRSKAILPTAYSINNVKLIFPKDADAGGTWIVLKENGDSACLLNGAFDNFVDTGNYTISRGKIVVEIATADNLINAFKDINLQATAPFTLIVVNKKQLFECRWDGEKKYCKALDNVRAYIWSSATLYDKATQQKREDWFIQFLLHNKTPSQKDLFTFHTTTGDGDTANDLLMNRDEQYFTVSITGIAVGKKECNMYYEDLKSNDSISTSFTAQYASS
jgi:Transport and Golgi organisation 2